MVSKVIINRLTLKTLSSSTTSRKSNLLCPIRILLGCLARTSMCLPNQINRCSNNSRLFINSNGLLNNRISRCNKWAINRLLVQWCLTWVCSNISSSNSKCWWVSSRPKWITYSSNSSNNRYIPTSSNSLKYFNNSNSNRTLPMKIPTRVTLSELLRLRMESSFAMSLEPR